MAPVRLGAVLSAAVLALLARASSLQAADEHARSLFEWALDLGVWTVVVFLLLLFVLKKFAWGPMLEGLKKREENLHAAIEEARAARQEAARLREYLDQEKAKMGEQVREAMDEVRKDAQRLKDDLIAQGNAQIQAERERLLREIRLERDKALAYLWTQLAQTSTLVSAKAIRRELNPDDHRRLVDEALVELKQAGDDWQRERLA